MCMYEWRCIICTIPGTDVQFHRHDAMGMRFWMLILDSCKPCQAKSCRCETAVCMLSRVFPIVLWKSPLHEL